MIYVFTKYVWVQPLKDKKPKAVLNAFNETAKKSKRQPNKLWVDQGREFYNNPMQKWSGDNDVFMYSTHNIIRIIFLLNIYDSFFVEKV